MIYRYYKLLRSLGPMKTLDYIIMRIHFIFSLIKRRFKVNNKLSNGYYVNPTKNVKNKKITIIIPTKNNHAMLKNCIESILQKTTYKNYEILIISNNTDDPKALKYLKTKIIKNRCSVIHYNKEYNFSAICNYGAKHANGEILLFLNDDTAVINSEWLRNMIIYLYKKNIGCVGATLLYNDNTIQHLGIVLGLGMRTHHIFNGEDYKKCIKKARKVSAVTGACLMIKKKIFDEINGFDANNTPTDFSDIDLCTRLLKKGYINIITPKALLYHYESSSRKVNIFSYTQAMLYVYKKNKDIYFNDPYYSGSLRINKTKL